MALTVGELVALMGIDDTQFNAKLAAGESKFTAASGRMNAKGVNMGKVGTNLTKFVSVPILAVAAASTVMAAKFDSAMNLIQTQAGGSAADVKYLSNAVLHMKDVQHSPDQLAAALYHLKSVGMDNVTAMKALTASEKLASVGHADLESTTNAVASAYKSGVRGAQNFGSVVASVNAIIGAGNLRMDDLNAAMGTGFLVNAQEAGVSLNDIGAALAMMTSRGIPATRAATALKMAMSSMDAPTNTAAKVMATLGLNSDSLAKALRSGGLPAAIGLLKTHMQGLSDTAKTADLTHMFGARSSQAILTLIGNLQDFNRVEAQVAQNATAKKFAAAYAAEQQEAEAKWHTFVATMQQDAVELGNAFLPAAEKIGEELGGIAKDLGKLTPAEKEWALRLAIVAAAAGPLIKVVTAVGTLGKAYSWLRGIMVATTVAQDALNASELAGGAAGAAAGLGEAEAAAADTARIESINQALSAGGPEAAVAATAPEAAAPAAAAGMSGTAVAGTVVLGAAAAGAIAFAIAQPIEKAIGTWASSPKSAQQEKQAFSHSTGASMRLQQVAQLPAAPVSHPTGAGFMGLLGGGSVIHVTADISDVSKEIATAKSELAVLAKKPQTAKVVMNEMDLEAKLADAKARLLQLTGAKHTVTIQAKIDSTTKDIADLMTHLKELGNEKPTPKVEADKSILEAALKTAKQHLASLNAQVVKPTATLADDASGPASTLRSNLISMFGTPIVQKITIQQQTVHHAMGGVFGSPHLAEIAEDGPEAVVPLSKPARALQVMQQAGLMGMASGAVAGGRRGGGGRSLTVQAVVPGGTCIVGSAEQVAHILAHPITQAVDRVEARMGRGT